MDMIAPVLLLCGLTLLMGWLLLSAQARLKSDAGDLVDAIDALLPQTQCAQCGYPGCRPYAQAVAAGASIDLCPPGGKATFDALKTLLGRSEGIPPPAPEPALARIREAECIGCFLCIRACPVDAIIGAPGFMHTVIEDECTGCELCVPACPVDCIDLIPVLRKSTKPATTTPEPNIDASPIGSPERTPASSALGTPTLGTPTLGTPTLGTPTLGTPTLGTPTFTLGTPTLGTPTFPLGTPTLGTPTFPFGTPTPLGTPTLGTPTLGAMGTPALGQKGTPTVQRDTHRTVQRDTHRTATKETPTAKKGTPTVSGPGIPDNGTPAAQPCIGCNRCEPVCPADLAPRELLWLSSAKKWDSAAALGLERCIECRLCDRVCPSDIPLARIFGGGKRVLADAAAQTAQAAHAKARFEAREARLAAQLSEAQARRSERLARQKRPAAPGRPIPQ